ncbi:MAG: trehalose-phosphatase [Phycisphaerae bacterium]
MFLASSPDKDNILFVLVCVPSRQEVPAYQELRAAVESRVGQINGRHATVEAAPIHFLYKPVDFTELCALYALADVAMVTPLRDGMNLVAKEYVACQAEAPGVLVLSEFAGAAEELFSALLVNPYNPQEVALRLRQALDMGDSERKERMERMRWRVMRYDARYWAQRFLADIESRPPAEAAWKGEAPDLAEILGRLGDGRLALFLDYDGTLREIELEPDAAAPTDEINALLDRLGAQPRIDTFLISGRKPRDIDVWFGGRSITLIAEHGFSYKRPGEGNWQLLNETADLSWMPRVLEALRQYEGATPGSWVEEKRASLVWHYRRADPQFGAAKARQLMSDLSETTYNLPVVVRHGRKIVEVCSVQADKAAAVKKFLGEGAYRAAICAGDDQTDENMFRVEWPNLFTIKVGAGQTAAHCRVLNPRFLRQFLEQLLDGMAGRNTPRPTVLEAKT